MPFKLIFYTTKRFCSVRAKSHMRGNEETLYLGFNDGYPGLVALFIFGLCGRMIEEDKNEEKRRKKRDNQKEFKEKKRKEKEEKERGKREGKNREKKVRKNRRKKHQRENKRRYVKKGEKSSSWGKQNRAK